MLETVKTKLAEVEKQFEDICSAIDKLNDQLQKAHSAKLQVLGARTMLQQLMEAQTEAQPTV